MALYDAFVSYSHAKDKPVAAALQSVIQRLGKPWYRRRALRVFRDDTSLSATPSLWPSIEQALGNSRFLILLASPEAASSPWVNKEISYWLDNKGADTLLVALTDGDLAWDNAIGDFIWREGMPLPPVLKGRFASEPKWVDLRAYRDGADPRDSRFIEAGSDFAAAFHGLPKEDLLSQEVRQQRRALRLACFAAVALLMLTGVASWQWAEAVAQRREAVAQRREAEAQRADAIRQRDRAERNLEVARKTAENLISKIAQGLQFVEGMRIEAIQQILETTRATMDELIRSAPDDQRLQIMRVEMLDEFAKTYRAAGALDRALAATDEALTIMRKMAAELGEPTVQSQLAVVLNRAGDIRQELGNRPGALAVFEESLAVTRALLAIDPANARWQRAASIAVTKIGDMRLAEGRLAEALAAYEEALAPMRKLAKANPNDPDRQRDLTVSLNKVGETKLAVRDAAAALSIFEETLAIRRRLVWADPLQSDWQQDLGNSLMYVAKIYYRSGKKPQALAAYEECLPIRRKLVSMDPGKVGLQRDLSMTLGTLGEIWLAEGNQSAAVALLEESVAILRELARALPSNSPLQTDLPRGLFSLALAVATVDAPRVRTLLQEAIMITDKLDREHRMDREFADFQRVLRESLSRVSVRKSR